ncbi:MAG: hypothetical protein OEM01_08730 [Desulfobulbaceae bacterium]|nr:hypothetical protein [Desulfobulbaceae bacterium]
MKKTCVSCGGSGQISYFKGESRFLLTTEECPECNGTGYLQENISIEKSDDGIHLTGRQKNKKGKGK